MPSKKASNKDILRKGLNKRSKIAVRSNSKLAKKTSSRNFGKGRVKQARASKKTTARRTGPQVDASTEIELIEREFRNRSLTGSGLGIPQSDFQGLSRVQKSDSKVSKNWSKREIYLSLALSRELRRRIARTKERCTPGNCPRTTFQVNTSKRIRITIVLWYHGAADTPFEAIHDQY